MRCQAVDDADEQCSNEARYIDEFGQLMCGICPIKFGADAIKLSDVPALLAWCREVLAGGTMNGSSFQALRNILGVKPEPVIWPHDPEPCYDRECERERGHDGKHRARSFNAEYGSEEIDEW